MEFKKINDEYYKGYENGIVCEIVKVNTNSVAFKVLNLKYEWVLRVQLNSQHVATFTYHTLRACKECMDNIYLGLKRLGLC